jgi:hypothetical protein
MLARSLIPALLFVLIIVPGQRAAAEQAAEESAGASVLEVEYDRAADLLSIHARNAPLGKLLQKLSERADLSFRLRTPALGSEPISLELKARPLEPALAALLRDFNSALVYGSPAVTGESRVARPVEVRVLSKKANALPTAGPVVPEERAAGRGPSQPLEAEQKGTIDVVMARLEQPPGFEGREFATYRRAIDAIKAVAPQRVVEPLVDLLVQSADPPLRVYAASILGEVGDPRAIQPLSWTFFNDDDQLARQVAMYGLIRIGVDSALEPVFKTFTAGGPKLQAAIALAFARVGNDGARARLAQLIADGRFHEDVTRVWHLAQPNTERLP